MKKILLISLNNEKNPAVFPLGIGYIQSSLMNEGFTVGVLDFLHVEFKEEILLQYMKSFNPDIIGISIRNVDNSCMSRTRCFIDQYKMLVNWIRLWNISKPIILGGAGFSLFPKQWMKVTDADFGIVGDNLHFSQIVFKKILLNQDVETIPGVIFKKGGKWIQNPTILEKDLDNIKFPERNGYIHPTNPNIVVRQNVQSKRGCIFKCSYCAYPNIEGRDIRLRSASNVVDEIEQMKLKYGIDEFDFVDSVFNSPIKHAIEICHEISRRNLNLRWGCFIHPKLVSDELFIALKDAGCNNLELGIDSGDKSCLMNLQKGLTRKDIKKSIELCNIYEIPFSVCLLLGGPGETEETISETLNLMDELHVQNLFALIGIRVLPDTDIGCKYLKENKSKDIFQPVFTSSKNIENISIKEIFTKFSAKYSNWYIV